MYGKQVDHKKVDLLGKEALKFVKKKTESGPILALDLACGVAAHTVKMAALGANVIACDIHYHQALMEEYCNRRNSSEAGSISFVKNDMQTFCAESEENLYDMVYFQRAIHYLEYHQAKKLTFHLRRILKPSALLFISASGLHSELGYRYKHKNKPIAQRFIRLNKDMRITHEINSPVCLYSQQDLVTLLESAGFDIEKSFVSEFGNIKIIARS